MDSDVVVYGKVNQGKFQPTVPGFSLAMVGPQSSLPRALSVLLIAVQLWYCCVQELCLDVFGSCLWPRSSTNNGSKVKGEHSPAANVLMLFGHTSVWALEVPYFGNPCFAIVLARLFWGFRPSIQTAVSHSCSCITTFSARWREVYLVLQYMFLKVLPEKHA